MPIVKYALEHLVVGDRIMYGHGGRDTFELNLSEPARTVILLFVGIVIFWILAGIAKAIIVAGTHLLRFGSSVELKAQHAGPQAVSPIKREA